MPVLGICYGEMTMSAQLGGKVEGGHNQEFGRADIHVKTKSPLLEGLAETGSEPVWMSHGDKITAIPPGFSVVATSESSPYAVIADEKRRFYGVQFHPEVAHTPARRRPCCRISCAPSPASSRNGTCTPSAPP